MPGLIYYDEIKRALGFPPKARISSVENELRRRGLPFKYGKNCLFATEQAWNAAMMGVTLDEKPNDSIDFLRD